MGYSVNDTRTSDEIPMEEKKRVLNESLDMILQEAADLGILDILMEEEETYKAGDFLDEAVQYSKTGSMSRTKEGWKNWYGTMAALAYARAAKDPAYAKLVKYSRLRKKYIALLKKKYNAKANVVARKKLKGAKAASISSIAKKAQSKKK